MCLVSELWTHHNAYKDSYIRRIRRRAWQYKRRRAHTMYRVRSRLTEMPFGTTCELILCPCRIKKRKYHGLTT